MVKSVAKGFSQTVIETENFNIANLFSFAAIQLFLGYTFPT